MHIPLDQYLRDKQGAEAERLQKLQEEQKKIDKAAEAERYAKLEALCNNPEFQWFIVECVKPLVDTAQQEALDIKKTPEERNNRCQQYFMANQIFELAEVMMEQAKNEAGYLEQE